MVDINKMSDEELFKFLDEEAIRIREERFIRPLPLRRKKLYLIATEEFIIKKNRTGDSVAEYK
jgi:hypothetical protein